MHYEVSNDIATICIDDGKANVVNHGFVDAMLENLQQAQSEAKAVVLTGREGMFCAGFDLKELQKGPDEAAALVGRGMEMLTTVFSHPQPVVTACDGHAIGLGAFLLLASDFRMGSNNDYNVTLPETAIGMPFTPVLMALIKTRISSQHQTAAVLASKPFGPDEAVVAGFLDTVVDTGALEKSALEQASTLAQLPGNVYRGNKEDLRSEPLRVMRAFES
jgi:enoyl-CoA hydratase